jgi:translocation and assembly module TamB
MRDQRFDRRSLLARALRVVYGFVLVVVAAASLLVGGTILLLQTRGGADLARRIALQQVNRRIAGRLAVARLAFSPDRLTLDGVALYDPEGRPVIAVERLEIAVARRALFRRHLDVEALVVRRPRVTVAEDPRGRGVGQGFGIVRALAPIAPRAPEPAEPARSGRGFTVGVRGWELTGGELDWRDAGGGRLFRLTELATFGTLDLADGRLRATVTVEAPDLRVDARGHADLSPARPASLDVTATAVVAGATASARATASGARLEAAGELGADDLEALGRWAGALLDRPLPELAGRAQLAVALSGPTAGPRLRVDLQAPALRLGRSSVRALRARAVVPDLGAPEALDLDVAAAAGAIEGHPFRTATVAAQASGRRVAVRARLTGPEPLSLDLAGRRDPSGRALRVDRLRLGYPEATWTLARPARVVFGPDRLAVSGLALAAGRQRIEADVARSPAEGRRGDVHETRGKITVTALDLSLLPRVLLPPGRRPGGRLDADLEFRAAAGPPRFRVAAALAGGRWGALHDVALRLDASGAGGRAQGSIDARGAGAVLDGTFDLPLRWPLPRGGAPVEASLSLTIPDLGAARAAAAEAGAARLPKLAGNVRVAARLRGSADAPALAVDAKARGLAVAGRALGDLAVELRAAGDRPSEARLEATGPPGARAARVRARVTSPLALGALLRRRPSSDVLARTPMEITATIDQLPLGLGASLVPRLPRLGGTLSARITLAGEARAPTGSVSVSLDGATAEGLRATDARLAATVGAGAIDAHARVLRGGRPLVLAEARLDAGAAALSHPAAFADTPVHAKATVGPLRIERHDPAVIHEQDRTRARAAIVRGAIAIEGSLRAPRAELDADARALGGDGGLVATARVAGRYAAGKATLDGRLSSAHDGTLHEAIELDADLGVEGLSHGLEVRRLPWRIELEARRFELDGLLGFVPGARTVGGQLDGTLRGQGTLRDPHLTGRLDGKASELAISGLGDYREVVLAVAGDENRLRLDKLEARAGAGHARVSGEVSRSADGFRLSARANLSRFPIYVEGQSIALLTIDATATGSEAREGAGIDVVVTQARVELSDEKRRDLQPLRTPPDVVVMQGGRPRGRNEAAKLRALPASVTGAAGVTPPPGPSAEERATKPVRLTLRAEHRIFVTSRELRVELGLTPGFRIVLGQRTEIFGEVTVRRGRVDVYGRRFDLRSESLVRWTGPPERPEVDINAQHESRDEGVTVLVTIKGQLPHTAIAVSSPNRPELTESQLYTLIIAGQLGSTRNATTSPASASTEALSLAGGLVAAGLQNTLTKSLHLDVFSIDTSGGTSLVGTQVEAGRYVTDRLYVGYVGRIGADPTRYQNRNAVHAEYRLTSHWEIEAEYGDVGTGSADMMWKKNY